MNITDKATIHRQANAITRRDGIIAGLREDLARQEVEIDSANGINEALEEELAETKCILAEMNQEKEIALDKGRRLYQHNKDLCKALKPFARGHILVSCAKSYLATACCSPFGRPEHVPLIPHFEGNALYSFADLKHAYAVYDGEITFENGWEPLAKSGFPYKDESIRGTSNE